jgi:hypothetical protein
LSRDADTIVERHTAGRWSWASVSTMIARESANQREGHEMTSGQGGPYGDPGPQGQETPPQGWNAPPPQQPYGQQYPGQQYPGQQYPGQQYPGQQYPGYTPAPSAPTGYGAPPAMERPTTVRAGIGALVASLVLGLISTIVSFSDIDTLVARTLATTSDPAVTEDIVRSGIVVGAVIGLMLVGLEVLFLWFAWKGANWARIVLWVLGGISVLFGLAGLAAGSTESTGFLTSLGWFQLLLTAAGLVLLALKPSNDWYRFRGWQRANGLP